VTPRDENRVDTDKTEWCHICFQIFAEAKINTKTVEKKTEPDIVRNRYIPNTVRTRSDANIGWNQENP
jgi:Holliday junction resolvasome RuvABC ATP-dependent DNA helicase subunit